MKRELRIAYVIAAALTASGCSTILANQARSDLIAQCASMEGNLRFLPGETRRSDNPLYSSASVQGQCVGPDHPDYATALVPEE